MKSRFFFAYVTSFFSILFLSAAIAGESAAALGAIIFSLSFAVLYDSANLAAKITMELKIIMGIIFAVLAAFDLYMLPAIYSLVLLAAFIPLYLIAFIEQRIGKESYLVIAISVFEVFSFIVMLITGYAAILAKFEWLQEGFIFSGAKFEEMLSAFFINLLNLVLLSYVAKDVSLKIEEEEKNNED